MRNNRRYLIYLLLFLFLGIYSLDRAMALGSPAGSQIKKKYAV